MRQKMLEGKIIVYVFIVCIIGIILLLLEKRSPVAKVIAAYPDEPKLTSMTYRGEKYKEGSASPWMVSLKPETMQTDTIHLDNKAIIGAWQTTTMDNPSLLLSQQMERFHIDQKKYYDYFYQHALIPIASGSADLTGDGKPDNYFISIGADCVSCHDDTVSIFVKNNIYTTRMNEGNLTPRKDRKGFYLYDAFTGTEYATCCPNNFVIRRFQWNGNNFVESQRKIIYVTQKK